MGAIDGRVKLAMCMRILYGEAPKSLAQLFRVSFSSVTDAFYLFLVRIGNCDELDFGVKVPTTEELEVRAYEFSRKSSHPTIFRHCVEAIDGLLIRINCPKFETDQRNFYSGHKLDYGLNLQASCDANCKFVNASMCCAGSANDINAFNASHLPTLYGKYPAPFFVVGNLFNTSKKFINPHSYTGDNAYPDSDSMLTPSSSGSVDLTHDAYNFFQSQIRIHIERAFGILNTVFAILQKPLKCEVARCCLVVQACLRLHNFRIDRGCQVCTMMRCCHLRLQYIFSQKVRQSRNLVYAFTDDEFDLLLSDDRYATAEHVDPRHRSLQTCQLQEKQLTYSQV
jgi:hypothetical protein